MRELLHQYFNIAFLMGKPQDLPAGRDQLKLGVLLALVTYLMALMVPYGVARALLQAIIDLGCSAVVMYLALSLTGRIKRFDQAFGGLCGASAFINLAALPLYSLRPVGQSGSMATQLPDFLLLVWGLSLLGHIIRHTFEVSMVISIVLSFTYFVFLSTLMSVLLPIPITVSSDTSGIPMELIMALWEQGRASV